MPKKAGAIFVILGAVLILSALLLFFYNKQEDRNAGQEAELTLVQIQSSIQNAKKETAPEPTDAAEETEASEETEEPTEPTEPLSPEMPKVVINGNEYIGYLSIPDLELELPVMADWTYAKLQVAPCRQFGSSRTDDLVIAAHNYASHFGTLKDLKDGAQITFTDMDGIVVTYSMVLLQTIHPGAIDAVQYSGHDLVLYTCTPGGAYRVAAYFDRVTEE